MRYRLANGIVFGFGGTRFAKVDFETGEVGRAAVGVIAISHHC